LVFFRGLPVRLFYVAPAAAVSFTLYEQFKKILEWNFQTGKTNLNTFNVNEAIITLAAGGTARLFGTACRTPFDLVKQRLQIQGSLSQRNYKNTFDAFKKIWLNEGFKGMWTGYIPSLVRDVPFAALYFCTSETMKSFFFPHLKVTTENGNKGLSTYHHLISGATAGALASCATIPFDVVKTRLQTQAALPFQERKYKGVYSTLKLIFKEEGYKGLTRGLTPRLIYIIPASSVTFACYERYKKLLGF